jgi:PPOX class probable F420-dependent enzyme
MDIPPTLLAELLDVWPIARLTSITPRHLPHSVPIVFCRDGAALYSPIDGKAKRAGPLQREANIEANPRVCVLLDEYVEDWQALWWVRLDGTAERHSPGPEQATRLRGLLQAKYPQYSEPGLLPIEAGYIRISWDRVSGWSQSGLDTALQRAATSRRR